MGFFYAGQCRARDAHISMQEHLYEGRAVIGIGDSASSKLVSHKEQPGRSWRPRTRARTERPALKSARCPGASGSDIRAVPIVNNRYQQTCTHSIQLVCTYISLFIKSSAKSQYVQLKCDVNVRFIEEGQRELERRISGFMASTKAQQ